MTLAGQVTVEYHPVAFFDDKSQGSQYSTRAVRAVAYVADVDPAHFVTFHEALLANQPLEGSAGLSAAQIAAVAVKAGVPKAVADEITIGGSKFAKWVAADTAQGKLDNVDSRGNALVWGGAT